MKRSNSTRFVAAAALAFAAFAAVPAAHARSDVYFSIGVRAPDVYVEPAPYYQPRPVYVQPAPVYQPRPVYVRPAPVYGWPRPVYVQPAPVYVAPPAYVYQDDRAWRHGEWRRRHWRHHQQDRQQHSPGGRRWD
jgi:hypothetical protein